MKFLIILFCILIIDLTAIAQKIPNIQNSGLRVPSVLNIDGKNDEINNQFSAHNNSTDLFYSFGNNDDHVYFICKAVSPDIIYKIINGGITLAIQPSKTTNDPKGVSITYPIFSRKNLPSLPLSNKLLISSGRDTTSRNFKLDSFARTLNEQLTIKSKEIRVKGIPELDSIISVYNTDDIKTAQHFDRNIAYTFEISIPIKYLKFIATRHTFFYHITINSIFSSLKIPDNAQITLIVAKDKSMNALSPTDFWGSYTLL